MEFQVKMQFKQKKEKCDMDSWPCETISNPHTSLILPLKSTHFPTIFGPFHTTTQPCLYYNLKQKKKKRAN